MRYHGGKFILSDWIISHFPPHKIYVEPFGGAASVLLKKTRCKTEIYNDLDNEVVNLFKVVRDHGSELMYKLKTTPYSRVEFDLSYESTSDIIEQARRTVVRSFMGFGSAAASGQKTGFRKNSRQSGSSPYSDWDNLPDAYKTIISRLKGVCIENRDAKTVMSDFDSDRTLHYIDPPYVLDTRSKGINTKSYKFEMSDLEHIELCEFVNTLKGYVIISGYDNHLYEKHLKGWNKVKTKALADGGGQRIEVLYINDQCFNELINQKKQLQLF